MNNQYVARYRELYRRHWWWRARERAILTLIDQYVEPRRRCTILDVGCGDGLLFEPLQSRGDVFGVEIDPAAVASDSPWRKQIHIGPFDRCFQPETRFDLMLMLDVLEHMPDPIGALRHAEELLADNGVLLLHVPAFPVLWTTHDKLNHHVTRYTRQTLFEQLAQTNLQVDTAYYSFHWTFLAKLAVRAKERLLGGRAQPPRVPSRAINSAAYYLCRSEQLLSRWWRPGFGSSLVAVARRCVPTRPAKSTPVVAASLRECGIPAPTV